MNLFKITAILTLTAVLAGCNTMDRLADVGNAPALSAIQDPTAVAGYVPVRMPMPEAIADTYQPNSLYRTSAKGFFKDERAHRIGDILTVKGQAITSASMGGAVQVLNLMSKRVITARALAAGAVEVSNDPLAVAGL